MANPIDAETARENALQFINNVKMKHTRGNTTLSMSFTVDRPVSATVNQPMVYAFNIGEGDGYILVSGDDAAESVLGYAEGGAINWNDMPENLRFKLEGYADEIAWAQENGYSKPANKLSSAESRKTIPNMVAAKWNQNYPYNYYCYFSGNECQAGCIATSMAEIMFYWAVQGRNGEKYEHGCKSLPSYRTSYRKFTLDSLRAVERFEWESMTTATPTAETSIKAVAKLIRYCGQSVKMDYDTYANGGSGAYTASVPKALVNYFGYDEGISYIQQGTKYSTEEWDEIIYEEIAAGRPVIMDGSNKSGTAAHAFICTGYHASTGLYYINWGWSGNYDGWYALNALRASSRYDYRYNNCAIIGIQPAVTEDMHYDKPTLSYLYLNSPRVLNRTSRSEDCETGVEMEGVFTYLNPNDQSWEYGIGIYDETGNLMKVINTDGDMADVSYKAIYSVVYGKHKLFKFHFGGELAYGTYELTPVYREDEASEWKDMYNHFTNYVKAEVESDKITLTPSKDIRVDELTSIANEEGGFTNTITITNLGCENTQGVYTLNQEGCDVALFEPEIAPGSTETITLDYTDEILDTDVLSLTIDHYGYTSFYSNMAESDYDEVNNQIYVENATDLSGQIYGSSCHARLYLSNKGTQPYRHTVTACVTKYGEEEPAITMSQDVDLASHEAQTLAFDFDDLDYGTIYDISLSFPHQSLDGNKQTESRLFGEEEGLTLTKGVIVATADGLTYHNTEMRSALTIPDDALYVDARHTDHLESLYAGGNTNTLYLLPTGATIPEALEKCNVVVGDYADHITLDHEHDFYSPIDFTAGTITYSRIFTAGHNGKNAGGWSTLVLPFAVESSNVTVGGKSTTWFKSGNDSGRKFWLYDFTSEGNKAITFSYTLGIEAYRPYLIAVPDNSWGSAYDLRDKTFVFKGYDAQILGGNPKAVSDNDGDYCFIGQTLQGTHSYIYTIDEAGSGFDFTSDETPVKAFSAYFVNFEDNGSNPVSVSFDSRSATPVHSILYDNIQEENPSVYSIDGIRLDGHAAQPKGIYIINGKKIIK